MLLKRQRLADGVFRAVAGWIARGKFPPGGHLDEIGLCRTLGVSRTPVREALARLEAAGMAESFPNRGFFVTGLSPQGVAEHYPIIAALDALALRLSPPFGGTRVRKLKHLNAEMAKPGKDSPTLYGLDLAFHVCLIESCPNPVLLSLIAQQKETIRRFDGNWKRGLANQTLAVKEHAAIIAALEREENAKAAALLERHWQGGIKTVLRWINSQKKNGEKS